jgi:hypothetical protein
MVSEQHLRNHYRACVQEIERLDRTIIGLRLRVQKGSQCRHADEAQLAHHAEYRAALAAQRHVLSGLLTSDSDEVTSATPHG